MTATLTIHYEDGEHLDIQISEVLELSLGPMAVTQIAFNRAKDDRWLMVVNRSLLMGRKLADRFLTAQKNIPQNDGQSNAARCPDRASNVDPEASKCSGGI